VNFGLIFQSGIKHLEINVSRGKPLPWDLWFKARRT
jgi:hypothetical protein